MKSWIEKLNDSKDLPKVIKLDEQACKRWGGDGTMIIPAPIEVDELMKKVPKGKVTTINKLRETLAKKHKASIGCPITTGIFAWIAAYAAEERRGMGEEKITPYWRTLKSTGELNPKYPGGMMQQKTFLEGEGIEVEQKGKKYIVRDFEKHLANLSN